MNKKKYRNHTKLVQPGLQIRLVASFVGLAGLATLLQFLLLGYRLNVATASIDGPGGELAALIPSALLEVLVLSFLVLMPLIFLFGVSLTLKIAGPVYRFEQYLQAVIQGEDGGRPCKIRTGDELQKLCDLINETVDTLRLEHPATEELSSAGDDVEADASDEDDELRAAS